MSLSLENVKEEVARFKKEFLNLFSDVLLGEFEQSTFDLFDPTLDKMHRDLKPKISLVGYSGVGKTTITRLIKAEEIPTEHIPTITGDISTIKIGKLQFNLWDFAGQEEFGFLWNKFIHGSDAVLLITNSSVENVEKSRYFVELIKSDAPHARAAIIGNKQDIPGVMSPEQIENTLGMKTYKMIAVDPDNRGKMITIIADILDISADISPLLQPLFERDRLMEETECALADGQFGLALNNCERISELSFELGDVGFGNEFLIEADKIRQMLENAGVTPPEPSRNLPALPSAPPIELATLTPPAHSPNPSPTESAPKSPYAQTGPTPWASKPAPPPEVVGALPTPQHEAPVEPSAQIVEQLKDPKSELETTELDLRVRLNKIKSMEFDLESKEIMGEISKEEYNEKMAKISKMKESIAKQLEEIQNILSSM